jgi:hypothetical protein
MSSHKSSRFAKENLNSRRAYHLAGDGISPRKGKFGYRSTNHLASKRKIQVSQHQPSRLDKENSGIAKQAMSPGQRKMRISSAIGVVLVSTSRSSRLGKENLDLAAQAISPRHIKLRSRKANHYVSRSKIEFSQGKLCRLDK